MRPRASASGWWQRADPDLRRFTKATSLAGLVALVVYVAVLWDFRLDPLHTALGGRDFSGFYDVQARQLLHGRLDVPPGDLGLEAFRLRGKEYMYFPPGPSLLRMPLFVVTDALDSKVTGFSMLGAWLLTAVVSTMLMWRVRLIVRGREALGRLEAAGYGVLLFTLLVGSVLLFLASLPFVYHEAYAWAVATAVGAAFSLIGLMQRPSVRGALTASAFTLGAVLVRTTAAWACAGGLLLAALWFASGRHGKVVPRRWVPTLVAAAVVPLGIGIGLNWVKFRHPYLFPLEDQVWTGMSAQRRAALAANGGDLVSPSILPATLVEYFRPDGIRFTSLFPYVTLPGTVPKDHGGSFLDQVYRTGSVVSFMPLLVLLSGWGLATAAGRRPSPGLRDLRIPLLAVAAIPGAIMFYGYIAMRYTAEFVPLFVVAGTLGYVDLARRLRDRPRRARAAFAAMALLAAFGFAANLAVSITSARTANPGAPLTEYLNLQARLSDRTPGRPFDDLVHQAPALPADGPVDRLQIVGDCRALYLGSGEPLAPWIPVDIQLLDWELDLRTEPTEPTSLTLAAADGTTGPGLQVEFDGDGRWRGTFESTEMEVRGRWRDVPDGVVHLRLFAYLTEQVYILVDQDRPALGLVDVPVAQLDPRPYRQQLVFRSVVDETDVPDGLAVTDVPTPVPATCASIRSRLPAGAR